MRSRGSDRRSWNDVLLGLVLAGLADVAAAETRTLSVSDPRPVAKAAQELEAKFGWPITYEDPPYVHASEVVDVTARVRRDQLNYRKVLVPRGGSLALAYREPRAQQDQAAGAASGEPDPALANAVRAALAELMRVHSAARGAQRFAVIEGAGMFHIIPTQVVNASGRLQRAQPLLDTKVSIPARQRTGTELIEEICYSLSSATGQTVILGTVPRNLLAAPTSITATNETARSVLSRFVATLPEELSWRVLHDPGLQWYALNFHIVAVSGNWIGR